MAKQWAKVGRDVKDSDRMTALLAKNPLAEALFWRIKAWADDFGRYVGEPEQIAAGICPRNVITGSVKLAKIKSALQDMEAAGVVRFYVADDGNRYLEIVDYLNHAHDKWANVGRPEYPAPPGWQPPPDLVDFLMKNAKSQNVSAERYGVSADNWPMGIEYPFDTHSIGIEYPGGRVSNTLGHDSDVDVDSDIDRDSPERADAPPAQSIFDAGLSAYCQALRTTTSNPAAEQAYSNVVNSYGEEAAHDAAVIVLQKFAAEEGRPNAGSVASYFLSAARTQSEKIAASRPADDPDPIRAEYTRANGPCPDDAFDRADWHQGLDAYRQQRGVA